MFIVAFLLLASMFSCSASQDKNSLALYEKYLNWGNKKTLTQLIERLNAERGESQLTGLFETTKGRAESDKDNFCSAQKYYVGKPGFMHTALWTLGLAYSIVGFRDSSYLELKLMCGMGVIFSLQRMWVNTDQGIQQIRLPNKIERNGDVIRALEEIDTKKIFNTNNNQILDLKKLSDGLSALSTRVEALEARLSPSPAPTAPAYNPALTGRIYPDASNIYGAPTAPPAYTYQQN